MYYVYGVKRETRIRQDSKNNWYDPNFDIQNNINILL